MRKGPIGNMIIVTFEESRILSITEDGLHYYDNEGERRFIDFDICYNNFVRMIPGIAGSKTKYVAIRNYATKPPQVIFLTDPLTKFEFPQRKREILGLDDDGDDDLRDFRTFRFQLMDAGVETFDGA
jgi:hypothetical protein